MRPYRIRLCASIASKVTASSWFDNGRTDRASLQDSSLCVRPRQSETSSHVVLPRRPVGTHDLCVRCVKSYSVMVPKVMAPVVLTGTDALPLDTIRASLQDSSLCVHRVKSYSVKLVRQRTHRSCVPTGFVSVRPLNQRLQRPHQSETSSCRDARSVRPLCQRLQRHGAKGYGTRGFNGDGRTDRASLQDSSLCVPTKGYSSRIDTTDALPLDTPVRLYRGTSQFST